MVTSHGLLFRMGACVVLCGSPFGSLVDYQFGALCGLSCDLASDAALCGMVM
jgi:hypothetical protein